MTLEALLAALHLVAVLTLTVFLSSQAALCRIEWLNAAVVQRLGRLNVIYLVCLAAVLASGLARVFWGIKGAAWYAPQPLLHLKVTLFVLMAALHVAPTLALGRWQRTLHSTGALPSADAVRTVHRLIMFESHLLPVIAVLAVFWARGW